MAKQGVARPDRTHTRPSPGASGQGEAQQKARTAIIGGDSGPRLKVHHKLETDGSGGYPVIDNNLVRDNVENDIPAADLEDL